MTSGRPRQPVTPVIFSVKLILRPGEDDDLIAFLRTAPPRLRATLVKLALRSGRVPVIPTESGIDEDIEFDGLLLG